tara:strand:- start:955 stop:1338 length:384 start_codon:yes stop_codon:yes gene_type:complete
MFKNNNKPIGNYGKIGNGKPLDIKKKDGEDWGQKPKDDWSVKKAPKPNPRLRAKKDLIDDYYQLEKISATIYNLFKEHIHHHSKVHIKKMLVEIHRNKKSFKEAHEIAEAIKTSSIASLKKKAKLKS